jgi:hypothetical protein
MEFPTTLIEAQDRFPDEASCWHCFARRAVQGDPLTYHRLTAESAG